MKRVLVLLGLIISSNILLAQTYKKEELKNSELQFISHNPGGIMLGVSKEALDKTIELNTTIYFMEITYKNELLYRASFRRYNPFGSSYDELPKDKFSIIIDYNRLVANPELILDLVSKYKWTLKEKDNHKYLYKKGFNLFKAETNYNRATRRNETVYKLNTLKPFTVKLYKLVERK